jgi:hypothetical protein
MVSKDNLVVTKRNGRGKESLNIEKIHSMVGFATENITGVSASHVEMNSGIQFFDGINTEDIQQILILTINMSQHDYYYSLYERDYFTDYGNTLVF